MTAPHCDHRLSFQSFWADGMFDRERMVAGQANYQWLIEYLIYQKLRLSDREETESDMDFALQYCVQYPSGKPTLVFDPYIFPLLKPDMLDDVDEPWMQEGGITHKEAIRL